MQYSEGVEMAKKKKAVKKAAKKAAKKPTKRGGARKGTGPKTLESQGKASRVPMSIRISPDLVAYLDTVKNKTGSIDAALRSTKGFKQWKLAQ